MRKTKTYAQLTEEISETIRKWGRSHFVVENDLAPRSRTKKNQTPQEREVRLIFPFWVNNRHFKEIRLHVRREATATENLALIAQALEMARLAEVREVDELLALLYRQIKPAPVPPKQAQPQPEPKPPQPPQVPPHYALLHLSPDAPLEIAEAVYRTMVKKHHPDLGGSTETMQRLNAAIERIRKERA